MLPVATSHDKVTWAQSTILTPTRTKGLKNRIAEIPGSEQPSRITNPFRRALSLPCHTHHHLARFGGKGGIPSLGPDRSTLTKSRPVDTSTPSIILKLSSCSPRGPAISAAKDDADSARNRARILEVSMVCRYLLQEAHAFTGHWVGEVRMRSRPNRPYRSWWAPIRSQINRQFDNRLWHWE